MRKIEKPSHPRRDFIGYEEWLALRPRERQRLLDLFDAYRGEGSHLAEEAARRFRERYGGRRGVGQVSHGVYHCGIWIISILVKGHPRLPRTFGGFPVLSFEDRL